MKIEISLSGKPHQVELVQVGERMQCIIDGAPLEADAVNIAPGIYSVLIERESFEARIERQGRDLRVYVANQEWLAKVRDPREWRRIRAGTGAAEGRQNVVAPMPGKVLRVLVQSGEAVEAKQGLFVVEAMKMQNEIRSPKAGKVERLLVTEGQSVNAGETLAVIN